MGRGLTKVASPGFKVGAQATRLDPLRPGIRSARCSDRGWRMPYELGSHGKITLRFRLAPLFSLHLHQRVHQVRQHFEHHVGLDLVVTPEAVVISAPCSFQSLNDRSEAHLLMYRRAHSALSRRMSPRS